MNGTFLYPKIFNRPQFRSDGPAAFFETALGLLFCWEGSCTIKKLYRREEADWINWMYLSIDLKSFYASVECLEHGLDPMTTNLVVADAGCTEKTICLAISPSLKSCGIPGRARLFKVKQAGQRAAAAI